MFYPFILMDIRGRQWSHRPLDGRPDQPPVPWRGRITLAQAPGQAGSSDKTAAAAAEVAAFFGQASASDFSAAGQTVSYHGPQEWSYRRFVLHYAHLCALAGGVDAFCIGSEMRSLTQIRDSADGYPAVRALCELAEDVRGDPRGREPRSAMRPTGRSTSGTSRRTDRVMCSTISIRCGRSPAIDFVGIDNYMPLSDWRDGMDHADAAAGSVYNLDYLTANVAGGEGFDWYYADTAGRDAQVRLPITDGAYGEHWVYRYKDLVELVVQPAYQSAWGREGGGRYGLAAEVEADLVHRTRLPGGQQGDEPAERLSGIPSRRRAFSRITRTVHETTSSSIATWRRRSRTGAIRRTIQFRTSMPGGWSTCARAHVWAWDARPWPDFPDRIETWVDGANYSCGHWLNGRASGASLAEVVAEICHRSGVARRRRGAALRRSHRILGRGSRERASVAAAADAGLCLRQLLGRRQAELRQPGRDGGGRDRAGDLRRDRARAGAGADAISGRRDGRAGDGRIRACRPRLRSGGRGGACARRGRAADRADRAADRALRGAGEGDRGAGVERGAGWPRQSELQPAAFDARRSTPGDVVSLDDGGTTDLYRIDRIEDLGHRVGQRGAGRADALCGAGGRDPGEPAQRPCRGVPGRRGVHRTAAADGRRGSAWRRASRSPRRPGRDRSPFTRRPTTTATRSIGRFAGRLWSAPCWIRCRPRRPGSGCRPMSASVSRPGRCRDAARPTS